MSSTQYAMGARKGYSPADALKATLTTTDVGSPSWGPMRAEAVCLALFCVLTESQQGRVLRALGWEPEAVDVSPLPAQAPTPGELEYSSWSAVAACHRRKTWGGCKCDTPAQRSTCMYRGKP